MTAGTGFRIFSSPPRTAEETVKGFSHVEVSRVADAMYGDGVLDPSIGLVAGDAVRIQGPALTVQTTPGNGLMIRAAIVVAQPGDILVVNGGGDIPRALFGGRLLREAADAGIHAVVVDGLVRDSAEMARVGVPVYARGFTLRSGTSWCGRGEVNVPLACGGVAFIPGDLVIGDKEGLVRVPAKDAPEVLKLAVGAESPAKASNDPGASRYRDPMMQLRQDGCLEIGIPWTDYPGR